MKTLILNSGNVLVGSNNSKFVYQFPGGGIEVKQGDTIGLQFIQIPYSWFNITARYLNNSFGYRLQGVTYNIPITDGFYTAEDLDNLLQGAMYNNGHYLLNSANNIVYYGEISTNTNLYGIQFNAYVINQTLPAGYTNPSGVFYNTVTFTGNTCLQLVVYNNKFSDLIGYDAGNYPAAPQATVYSAISNKTPNLTPVNSVVVRCSLCHNPYGNPQDLFYAFAPDVTFGSNINVTPNVIGWLDCKVGMFTTLEMTFVDQNFKAMYMNDPNTTIQLLLRDKDEK